MINDDEEDG